MNAVTQFFESHPDIEFVRLLQVDYGNVVRARIVPKIRFSQMSATREDSGQIATLSPLSVFFLSSGEPRWDIVQPNNDDHWIPDWPTLRPFPAEPRTAIVMCFIKETAERENPFDRCPRDTLRRVLAKAQQSGIEYIVGHELEFTLMSKMDLTAGVDNMGGNWTTSGLRHEAFNVVQDAVGFLEEAGIRVWNFVSEGGAGQYEIALGPLDPMGAADAVVYASETIKTVAARRGLHATLHPYPFEGASPVGLHTHVSMNDPENHSDPFLAGILEHGKALSAFLLGGLDSFHPSRVPMVGAGDITWGTYKFAPLHRLRPGRFEIRWPDNLTNPHLQIAAILGIGSEGIKQNAQLTMKPSGGNGIGQPLSVDQKSHLNVKHRVPDTLSERVAALTEDQAVFEQMLGPLCVQSYMRFRMATISKTGSDTASRRTKEVMNI